MEILQTGDEIGQPEETGNRHEKGAPRPDE